MTDDDPTSGCRGTCYGLVFAVTLYVALFLVAVAVVMWGG